MASTTSPPLPRDLLNVRRQVAEANRVLAELGFAAGILAGVGHASMRVPSTPGTFVVKGVGYAVDALARMQPEHMVLCNLEGYTLDAPPGISPNFEVQLHAGIYRARPDVQSVVHVHPRFVVLMSVLGRPLVPMCLEGIALVQEPLPVYPHVKTVQAREDGEEVASLLGTAAAIILQGHGAATVATSLAEATMSMLWLEEQARMNWYAICAAGLDHPRVSDELIREIADRPRPEDLPHFRDVAGGQSQPRLSGIWSYFTDLVSPTQ